jgi:hypothetical protein
VHRGENGVRHPRREPLGRLPTSSAETISVDTFDPKPALSGRKLTLPRALAR